MSFERKRQECKCGAKGGKKHYPGCSRRKPTYVTSSGRTVKISDVFRNVRPIEKKKNHVALVVDTSGSMGSVYAAANASLRDQLAAIKQAAHDNKIETYLTYVTFDVHAKVEKNKEYVHSVGTLEYYRPTGTATNVHAGVVMAFDRLKNEDGPKLMTVITDGQHNYDDGHKEAFEYAVRRMVYGGDWTLTFIGPRNAADPFKALGVPRENMQFWEGGVVELEESSGIQTRGIGNYYATLSSGGTKTSTFYAEAEVDKFAVRSLPKEIGFKQALVDKECEISDFVRRAFGGYRVGSTFYELTKSEKVQSYKDLLLMDGKTGVVYGGNVRKAIGVPETGDGRVTPGNLKGYRVFVESTSVNRKLIPGTTVLVRS